jgi:F-type H+-transporting ATPase subunit alpha
MSDDCLKSALDTTLRQLGRARRSFIPQFLAEEIGTVTTVSTSIAKVSGLPDVGFEELVEFPNNLFGIAFNLDEDEVGVVLLGDCSALNAGAEVRRTGRVMDVPVGDTLIGRVIDPLGSPLDGKGPIAFARRSRIEREAPHIMDRAPVTVPLQTGIKVIDALIPIGRGQRELILGDRQTGKTAIAVDTIINQRETGVVCVYCTIGQRAASVAKVIADLNRSGAMDFTVVLVSEGNDPPGLKYIAPYAATAVAEYFMEKGRDALIIYDDLTQHARAYRELSLLLRRPPGREAFPGDIFYIHSRLLERATHLRDHLGGGSLTALPIVETEAQNISAYLPTNLISITDGQIYLSPNLFELGILPAIDVGKSVSRVGGKAQLPVYRAVTGALKLSYAQFEELESFARFGTRLDDQTRKIIAHGQRVRACLQQPQFQPVTVAEQIAVLLALTDGMFDPITLERVTQAEQTVRESISQIPTDVRKRLLSANEFHQADRQAILEVSKMALQALAGDPSIATLREPHVPAGTSPKPHPPSDWLGESRATSFKDREAHERVNRNFAT